MKKSKKLLSVLLAVLMLLSSMSVMASAAKANYKTYDDLAALNGGAGPYSKYGAVTRVDTETRTSMLLDVLDPILESANINLGKVIDINIVITRYTLTIDLRSVNALCKTIDEAKTLLGKGLVRIVKGALGVIADANLNSWQSGMTREGTPQFTILSELMEVLSANSGIFYDIINTGKVDLGLASSAVKNLDLSVIADIPGLIKGMVFPMFERKDDDQTQIAALMNTKGDGGLQTVLNSFVNGLFTKPQSTTTYKEDAEGNCISDHKLPTEEDNLRYYYKKGTDEAGKEYYECYYYDTENGEYVAEDEKFYKVEESEGVYTYRKESGDGLKYYKEGSYWLDSITEAVNGNSDLVDLEKNSAASLLYNLIPYVFAEMAPVVLNGSAKKLLGGLLGAEYTYVGDANTEEVLALPDAASSDFFTKEQGEYVWEWTDYEVINGNHYYRYEDKIFAGDISGANPFFALIDWDYEITGDFVNEFVPGADGTTASAKGYTTLLQGLNDFLVKAAKEIMEDSFEAKVGLVEGDNTNLITNIKKAAQAVVKVSPETVFGAEYNEPDKYYSLIMSDDNQEVLIGIACTVIPMLMPQMILPTADTIKDKGYTIGAVLAAVLRELATQLVPNHNYDALIYSDYNNKTFVAGKNNEYWLDVILTMGTDIGVYYLMNLADMGDNTDAWTTGMPYQDKQTYKASDLDVSGMKVWEARVDYIVDWALSNSQLWSWKFENFVDCGANIDLAVMQDPWVKLGTIFASLLPIDQVFNVNTGDSQWLKTLLKDNFVLAIADLKPERIAGENGVLNIPTDSVLRKADIFTQITTVFRNLLNGLFYKLAGNKNLIASNVTNIDAVLNQANLANFVKALVDALDPATKGGLFDTILPILQFFVGWTTDAQVYKDPEITFVTDNGYLYANGSSASATLKVQNSSSGMLLEHRTSDVNDASYIITITDITANKGTISATGIGTQIMPGSNAEIPFTLSYSGDTAVTVTISYTLTGKDGKSLGGTQTIVAQQYISNQLQSSNPNAQVTFLAQSGSIFKTDQVKVYALAYEKILFADTLSAVDLFGITFKSDKNNAQWVQGSSEVVAPQVPIQAVDTATYVHGNNENEALKEEGAGHLKASKADDYSDIVIRMWETDPDFKPVSGTSYSAGSRSLTWRRDSYNATQTLEGPTLYYYNVRSLEDLWDSCYNARRDQYRSGSNVDTLWNTFSAARDEATKLILAPKNIDTFAALYSEANIKKVTDNLRNAYNALSRYYYVESSLNTLTSALQKAEPGEDVPEINFQDYVLYEYFEYQDYRTAVRNRIKEYYGPVAPEQYIPTYSQTGKAVDELIAAESNEKLKLALSATVVPVSEEEMAAYQTALAEWQEPNYTKLDNEDISSKLLYYKQFLELKTTEQQFLTKEIAYAAAQQYVEENYSKDSWAAYEDALKNAQTVAAKDGALQSEVFDAKYALMVAENNLLEASKSAKDNGALSDLEALIAKANDIFENSDNYTVVEGMDETDAYKQLIEALGYKTEDGEILYDHSALTFIEYDRETTQNNLDRIKAAEEKLQAAIDNFESLAADPDIFPHDEDVGVVDTDNGVTADNAGYLYGVAPGQDIHEVFGSSTRLEIESVHADGVTIGTGAKVHVCYEDGRIYETYTLIIFGDVNGDGKVNSTDSMLLERFTVGNATVEGAYNFASDVNGDHRVNTSDSMLLERGTVGTATIEQNPF